MVSEYPKQMQTRGKNIAKRVQTQKSNTNNFWGKYIKQIINSNFANKTHKKQQDTKNTSQLRLITHRTKESKNSATKTAKQHHKRQTSTYKSPWP